MNPQRTVQTTWFTMLIVQTIGAVDGKHKLPAPKMYVAINVAWGILFLLTDTGMGKLASRLSMLLLLTASVMGPFGAKLIGFLNTVTKSFAIPPSPDAQASAGSFSPSPSGVVLSQ